MQSDHPAADILKRVAGVALLVAVIVAFVTSDSLHATLLQLVEQLAGLFRTHPVLGALSFVLFSALSAMLAFVSAAVAVPVAVVALGQPLAMLLMWLGWVLGGAMAFCIGRYLGRPVVTVLAGKAALQRFERHLHADTPFVMILLFQMALPSELPGYLLGMLRYPLPKYLLALAIVELPYAAATVWLGAGFLQRNALVIIGIGALGIVVSLVALKLLRHRLR